jgi:membrane-associated phospholipid phosphatase
MGGIYGYLANFREKAARLEPCAPVDPRSMALYAILLAALLITLACIWLSGYTFSTTRRLQLFITMFWLIGGAFLARRYGLPKVAGILEAVSLPIITGALIAVGTTMLTPISLPLADETLARADALLGFDWLWLFSIYQSHPWIIPYSDFAYSSMVWQLPLIPIALFVLGQDQRAWIFLTAWAVAGIITAVIYPFLPAEGPFLHYGITPADLPELKITFPWYIGPLIEALQNGEIRDLSKATGLVSFPSFHTAAGVMFMWAAFEIRWLRVPAIVLNAAMIASTIVHGSHYFVDLAGGVLVAGVAIVAAKALVRRPAPQVIAHALPE